MNTPLGLAIASQRDPHARLRLGRRTRRSSIIIATIIIPIITTSFARRPRPPPSSPVKRSRTRLPPR